MAKIVIPMGFNESCCRFYVMLFNVLFSSLGFFMICLGLWMLLNLSKVGVMKLDDTSSNLPWLAIAYGVIVVLSGCVSYLFLRRSLFLFMYASCLFVLFIFGISLGILAYIFISRLKDSVMKGITFHMENYLSDPKDTVMDRIQPELECCGNMEPTDWLRTSTGQIPPSCCKVKLCDPTKGTEIYDKGCYSVLTAYIKYYEKILALAAIIGSVIPFLGCITSFVYAYHTVDKKYEQVQ